VDFVVVITASAETQKNRVMQRPGMTLEKFQSILAKQMPDSEKRALADFIVDTDFPGRTQAKAQVARMLEAAIRSRPDLWHAWKARRPADTSPQTAHRGSLTSATITPITSLTTATGCEPSGSEGLEASHAPAAASVLCEHFDAIAFDLDDTLTAGWAPVLRAQDLMYQFIEQRMPKTATIARTDFKAVLARVSVEQPLLVHDLGALREEVLRELCRAAGAEDELQLVPEAMQLFVQERSAVDSHMFPDSRPLLEYLSSALKLKVLVLSNGNANLAYAPELSKFVNGAFSAGEIGAAKPSIIPFVAMTQLSGLCASRILYIGDSYKHDVAGAREAGHCVAWLDRTRGGECVGDVQPDFILHSLDVCELEEKVCAWVRGKSHRSSSSSISDNKRS